MRDPEDLFTRVPRLTNLQTKYLAGMHLDEPNVDAGVLATARANLDRLAFEIAESFDSSMALFIERLRFGIPKFDIMDVSRWDDDDDLLTDEFPAAATRHNDIDQQLYEYATELLRERIADFVQTLIIYTPGDHAALQCRLRFRRQHVEQQIRLPADGVSAAADLGLGPARRPARRRRAARRGRGGHPARPADRAQRSGAGHARPAQPDRGGLGTLRVPPDATEIDLVAFDGRDAYGAGAHSRSCGSTRSRCRTGSRAGSEDSSVAEESADRSFEL